MVPTDYRHHDNTQPRGYTKRTWATTKVRVRVLKAAVLRPTGRRTKSASSLGCALPRAGAGGLVVAPSEGARPRGQRWLKSQRMPRIQTWPTTTVLETVEVPEMAGVSEASGAGGVLEAAGVAQAAGMPGGTAGPFVTSGGPMQKPAFCCLFTHTRTQT